MSVKIAVTEGTSPSPTLMLVVVTPIGKDAPSRRTVPSARNVLWLPACVSSIVLSSSGARSPNNRSSRRPTDSGPGMPSRLSAAGLV